MDFDSMLKSNSYISYSKAPESWKTDNDKKYPKKKHFKNTSWDEEERLFRGVIDWRKTPVKNAAAWFFTMTFSEDFSKIESGVFEEMDANGITFNIQMFGEELQFNLKRNPEDYLPLIERECENCEARIPADKAVLYCCKCNFLQCETCMKLRGFIAEQKSNLIIDDEGAMIPSDSNV